MATYSLASSVFLSMVDVMSDIWCPVDPEEVSESTAGSALPVKPPAGGLEWGRAAPVPTASDSIHTPFCADRVRHIKRQTTPVEMAARHEIFGPAALQWWRTLSSFPEATCPRWHFHVIATGFHHSAATLRTWSDVDAVKRSLVWISASVRLVCASLTRSSDWGRYCAAASCWFKYVAPPLGLCFRFPLPAHDCLTMGGNQS